MKAGVDFDRWDVLDAHYWWSTNHHGGQWSPEYARLGRIHNMGYRPGRIANGPATDASRMIYAELCARAGCTDCEQEGGEI